jgi:uncharacterized membrane protein
MSTLVVVAYDDPFKAEEVRLMLQKMQKDHLIDPQDAVVAVKDKVLEQLAGTGGRCSRPLSPTRTKPSSRPR